MYTVFLTPCISDKVGTDVFGPGISGNNLIVLALLVSIILYNTYRIRAVGIIVPTFVQYYILGIIVH